MTARVEEVLYREGEGRRYYIGKVRGGRGRVRGRKKHEEGFF